MKKAVIFDLDGTLLDTLESIALCGNRTLEKFGFDSLKTEQYAEFVGNGADVLVEKLMNKVSVLPSDRVSFKETYFGIYLKHGSDGTEPYAKIPELLTELKNRGMRIIVYTNKPQKISEECCLKYFGDVFDCICGQIPGLPTKPDVTRLAAILKQYEISPDECIYCGDSTVDVQTGKNAGIQMLGAAWGFYGDTPFKTADGILYSPLDMIKYI